MIESLQHLNPEQYQAVTQVEGPLLVIAGAGSGKTRVITHRIAYLIQQEFAQPWQIFASTFTNKAAREMRERVYKLLGAHSQARLAVSTFHSFCANLLRRESVKAGLSPRFTILDDTDQKGIVRSCMQKLEIDSKVLTPEQVLDRIGQAKIRMLGPDDVDELFAGGRQEEYTAIYREYEEMLRRNDAVDFDDLILRVVRLFESDADTLDHYQNRYQHLLVDEYQDTNLVQFRLIELMAGKRQNLCVVGDEDQSIYSWRGAEITNLLNFQKHFPTAQIVRLEQNYRSTKTILEIADAVIEHNTERLGKHLWTDGAQGNPGMVYAATSSQSEGRFVVQQIQRLHHEEGIPYNEMGVFYRINALSRAVEDELRAENIPYRVIGGIKFYDRMEIKDILAYLTVVANPYSNLALSRVINRPKRGIGEKSVQTLMAFADRESLPLYEVMTDLRALDGVPKKAAGALMQLRDLFEKWRERMDAIPLDALVQLILDDTQYIESLGDEASLEAVTRTENINELLGSIKEYEKNADAPSIYDYLERVALAAGGDEAEPNEPSVSLMTLHAAKGLEFRAVFMIGLEENLFPSPRAIKDRGNIEEERRLFYVGITRAKQHLFFSWAKTRLMYGRQDWTTPSVFLSELPRDYCASPEEADEARLEDFLPRDMQRKVEQHLARYSYKKKKTKSTIPSGNFYAVGQRVEHLFLGQGEIVAIEGDGAEKRLTVRFEDGETSEVLERYGDLRIVG